MAWKSRVLVIANQTAPSDELVDALRERAERGACEFVLIVPKAPYTPDVPSGREEAERNLKYALERMGEAGLEVDGMVGDSDPITAVQEVWDPTRFDEIVVSTLPTGASRWLRIDLPRRLQRMCDVPVTHVEAARHKEPVATVPPPEHDHHGLLTPLVSLSWGKPRDE